MRNRRKILAGDVRDGKMPEAGLEARPGDISHRLGSAPIKSLSWEAGMSLQRITRGGNAMGWKAPLLFTLRVPSNKTYRKNSAAWADVVASQQTRARLFEEPYRSVGVLTKAAS